jgi:hypothetical protein
MTAPPKPVELSLPTRARLRRAGSWSRLVAVFGLVVGAIIIAGYASTFAGWPKEYAEPKAPMTAVDLTAIPMLIGLVGGGVLLWGYARNVAAFFRQDESALPRAFRKLRYSVMLWTFGLALMTALSAVSAWSKL